MEAQRVYNVAVGDAGEGGAPIHEAVGLEIPGHLSDHARMKPRARLKVDMHRLARVVGYAFPGYHTTSELRQKLASGGLAKRKSVGFADADGDNDGDGGHEGLALGQLLKPRTPKVKANLLSSKDVVTVTASDIMSPARSLMSRLLLDAGRGGGESHATLDRLCALVLSRFRIYQHPELLQMEDHISVSAHTAVGTVAETAAGSLSGTAGADGVVLMDGAAADAVATASVNEDIYGMGGLDDEHNKSRKTLRTRGSTAGSMEIGGLGNPDVGEEMSMMSGGGGGSLPGMGHGALSHSVGGTNSISMAAGDKVGPAFQTSPTTLNYHCPLETPFCQLSTRTPTNRLPPPLPEDLRRHGLRVRDGVDLPGRHDGHSHYYAAAQ